jgi:hypothetical protein
MSVYTTNMIAQADRAEILDVLTDAAACATWSPFPFGVDGVPGGRLAVGCRVTVSGGLAGRSVAFGVEVVDADLDGLRLRARGPVDVDVDYALTPAICGGTQIAVRVSTSAGGLRGRLLVAAVDSLLAAGALERALSAISRAAEASVADRLSAVAA